MDKRQVHPGFARVVEFFGSQAEMARAVGITPQSVSGFRYTGFSPETALRIERLTNGTIRAVDIARELERA